MFSGAGAALVSLGLMAALSCHGAAPRRKTDAYPRRLAGLEVGRSVDRDVRRLFGTGFYVPDEGHTGGRCFVSRERNRTLHVELGVDRIVDNVEYGTGVRLPLKGTARKRALTRAASARVKAGERLKGGITLGASPADVIRAYGHPSSDTRKGGRRVITYEADYQTMPNVLNYEATFEFKAGRLSLIRLYNGE